MYLFKRHNLGLTLAILMMAVVACRGQLPALPSPPASRPMPTEAGGPALQSTPSPKDISEHPRVCTPQTGAPSPSSDSIQEQARDALADWLEVSSEEIELLQVEEVKWPDTSLGCPEPGMVYAQVIVPGWRVVMRVEDDVYEYHGGREQAVLCDENSGPIVQVIPEPTVATPIAEATVEPQPTVVHIEMERAIIPMGTEPKGKVIRELWDFTGERWQGTIGVKPLYPIASGAPLPVSISVTLVYQNGDVDFTYLGEEFHLPVGDSVALPESTSESGTQTAIVMTNLGFESGQ